MGQVCSGTKSESRRPGALEDVGFSDDRAYGEDSSGPSHPAHSSSYNNNNSTANNNSNTTNNNTDPVSSKEEAERLKQLRQEEARLHLIVSAAERGMVAVRSARGSTGYYDQGFAAALAQHLEETTQFPGKLALSLPPPPSSATSVYERLSKPQWEGISLGTSGGLAGCGGEHPIRYMDNLAESLLDAVVPSKQQLFVGAHPIVENLL